VKKTWREATANGVCTPTGAKGFGPYSGAYVEDRNLSDIEVIDEQGLEAIKGLYDVHRT